jgi:hypothetical protein
MLFEDRILRRIFGPKRDENGERRLHIINIIYNITRIIKSTRLRKLST